MSSPFPPTAVTIITQNNKKAALSECRHVGGRQASQWLAVLSAATQGLRQGGALPAKGNLPLP